MAESDLIVSTFVRNKHEAAMRQVELECELSIARSRVVSLEALHKQVCLIVTAYDAALNTMSSPEAEATVIKEEVVNG